MLRRFLRDSAIYSVSAILSRGVSVVLIPLYTRFLQPYEYGVFDLLMIAATLANYLVSLEISQGLARVYSEARDETEKRACVSSAAWFCVLAYVLFVIVASVFSTDIASVLLGSPAWSDAVQTMIAAVAANGIFFLLQDLLRWQLKPMKHALASIAYSLTGAAVGAMAVAFLHAGVVGMLAGQIAGAIVGVFITLRNGSALHWHWEFNRDKWKEMAKYSAPQVISSCTAYFALYVDRLFIKENLSLDEVGIYGVGARLASLVALLMVGFQSGYIPIVFHNHAAPETPPQMERVFRYFLVAAIAVVLFLSGFSGELLKLLTTERYFNAWHTIPVLATGMLLANMYIFAPGIFISRRTLIVAGINVGALCLTIAGNFLLLPRFGAMGAAFAVLITSTTVFLVYVYFNARFYPIPFAWRRIALAVAVGGLVGVILFDLQTLPGLWVFLGKAALFFIGVALALKLLLDKAELKQAFDTIKIARG
jgi:O-antigen/teichoic acid export membrane protein